MPGSVPPLIATALVLVLLAWFAWAVRRFRLLSAYVWLVIGIDLTCMAWFAIEAYPCTPERCEYDQAAVILVYMFLLDILLALVFAIVGVTAWIRRWRAAHGT